jgi:hypothetical protein
MNTKNLLKSVFLSLFLFLISSTFSKAVAAPRVYLNPGSATVSINSEFEIQLNIDVENSNVFGADVVLTYPGNDIELKSLTGGGFFPSLSYANDVSGRLEIHAFFPNLYESKNGSGNLATLNFTAKKDSGTGSIDFTCSGGGNDTQILNTIGENILSCGVLNQSNLSYIPQGAGDDIPPSNGDPNECGGTCGSNYNCQEGLFCYQEFCRNPACQTDTDCVCPTAAPTLKPKVATAGSPTPQAIELNQYSPPLVAEETTTEETPMSQPLNEKLAGFNTRNVLLGGGVLFSLIVIIIAIRKFIEKRKPPTTTPPITPPTVKPPLPTNPPSYRPPPPQNPQ